MLIKVHIHPPPPTHTIEIILFTHLLGIQTLLAEYVTLCYPLYILMELQYNSTAAQWKHTIDYVNA